MTEMKRKRDGPSDIIPVSAKKSKIVDYQIMRIPTYVNNIIGTITRDQMIREFYKTFKYIDKRFGPNR